MIYEIFWKILEKFSTKKILPERQQTTSANLIDSDKAKYSRGVCLLFQACT